jgi:hypothetical protein
MNHTTLSVPGSSSITKPSFPVLPTGNFSKKTRKIFTLPGLTGPVVVIGSPHTKTLQKGTICHDIMSLVADILDLRAWRKMDPLACFILAGYTAIVSQPLVYGNLGSSIVALMTPTR